MEDMGELMCQELMKEGWIKDGDEAKQERGEWSLSFDPLTQMLSIVYTAEELFEAEYEEDILVYDSNDSKASARKTAMHIVGAKGASMMNERLKDMDQEFLVKKEDFLIDLENALNPAIEQVMKEALKRKAASLGEVQSLEDTNGELIIRVKV